MKNKELVQRLVLAAGLMAGFVPVWYLVSAWAAVCYENVGKTPEPNQLHRATLVFLPDGTARVRHGRGGAAFSAVTPSGQTKIISVPGDESDVFCDLEGNPTPLPEKKIVGVLRQDLLSNVRFKVTR